MTFKQQMMIDKLKRYFDNEDEYNYKNVMCNILRDKHFEDLIIDYSVGRINAKGLPNYPHPAKYEHYYKYKGTELD